MTKTPLDELSEIDRFYHTFGKALAQWAELEYYLSLLFACAADLTFQVAEAIFYSGRSFRSRADLLAAALTHSKLNPAWTDFVEGVLLKAVGYEGFRNQLAHRTFHPNALDDNGGPIEWRLKEGNKWNEPDGISASQVETACANFLALTNVIVYALHDIEKTEHPTKHLERLVLVPSEATSSQPSRKQLGRLRQQQASLRKSKRQNRAK